ncbi:MAG TPA: DNA primase [Peptococcaceae bacterium]|nr:DNA primase [Peptococcaceae bacterium]
MGNRIPEDLIEEVRRQADIVEIISEHVVLKRSGKNYLGLCPFHSEKTPSFNVNPDKQMFYCFGCQTGGNVFSFLMKIQNLTFLEAVKAVAARTGIALPERELSPLERKKEQERKRFREIHEWAAAYFTNALLNSPEGRTGLEYLKKRNVSRETIELFRLGYAPDKWDGLLAEMTRKGVTLEELVKFGLVVQKVNQQDGSKSYYDRFRGRIIFTILDLHSSPIAFGGRVLDDSLPKYLNSPETAFFHKGSNLYGLHYAYRGMREAGYALLLEGYMDTIAVYQAGFTNVVASLGTALTRDQARVIKRYCQKVIIGYDTDAAGVQATIRAGEILLEEGFQVKVLQLGSAKDPDEFLKKHTPEEFRQQLDKSVTFIEYKYKTLAAKSPPKTIPDKAELVRKLAPDILKIASAVEREGYERYLSLELGLTLEAVQHEIASFTKDSQENKREPENFSQKQDISVKKRNTIRGMTFDYLRDSYVPLGVFRAEQIILRLVLEDPSLKAKVRANLEEEFWRLKEHKYIFENYPENSLNCPDVEDSWYEQIQKRLAEIYQLEINTEKAETILMDCIEAIKNTQNRETIEDLQAKMIRLEKSGDMAGALAVLQEIGERLKRGEK